MKCNFFSILIILILLTLGCASTVPVTKYMPEKSDDIFPFFSSGQPIAAVGSENAFMLLSLDPDYMAGRPYIRLWMLYQNISDEPYLLEPLQVADLITTRISSGRSKTNDPESPTKILAHISNEKAATMIMQAIGGSLQALAAEPTTATTRLDDGSSAITTFNDRSEKQGRIADRTAGAMANTSMWYDIYQSSISDGILRRNTVFPGQSVNGYIYIPFPGGIDKYEYFRTMLFRFTVVLHMTEGDQEINFAPIEGE